MKLQNSYSRNFRVKRHISNKKKYQKKLNHQTQQNHQKNCQNHREKRILFHELL